MSDTDIVEAKKAINCLMFAIDDASVLADVKRIMQGMIDEVERLRAGRVAMWAECREACAKVADRYAMGAATPADGIARSIAQALRALEVPNE